MQGPSSDLERRSIKLLLDGSYDAVVGTMNRESFEKSVTSSLATALDIDLSRIEDVQVS